MPGSCRTSVQGRYFRESTQSGCPAPGGAGFLVEAKPLYAYGQRDSQWETVGGLYRQQLFERGQQTERKAGFSPEAVKAVLDGDGKLTLSQALRCRVRYFSDGVVLGSKAFVEDVFQRNRKQFGLKRKSGARMLRRAEAGDLCTMRDLRQEAISPPKAA